MESYNPYVKSPGGIWINGVGLPIPKLSRQVRRQLERRVRKANRTLQNVRPTLGNRGGSAPIGVLVQA